jgi:type III restriction enzyme
VPELEPPAEWRPTQAVEDPVLNSPYEEPSWYWRYQDGVPQKMRGRRPAMYWYQTKKVGEAQQDIWAEEQADELALVNRLRADVGRWRERDYEKASKVTKDLLAWWRRKDAPRRLFFCQIEAVETLIYLLELGLTGALSQARKKREVTQEDLARLLAGQRPSFHLASEGSWPRLVDPPNEPGLLPLPRLGCKMATGAGKTVVMAMLIAWAFCNRGRNRGSSWFPSAVLVCAPNLTVRERLQVLKPEDAKNYYDEFEIVPPKYRELLNDGKVLVTNWHAFAPKSEHSEGGTSYRVVDKGEETSDAFTLDRLGDLAGRLPLLVLNDEGHHCWRPAPGTAVGKAAKGVQKGLSAEERRSLEEEAEEARVWLAGLDRIHNSGLLGPGKGCVLAAVDLSATPFYLANSGYPEGSPFPWLVSDFGLVDAIESGIVKIPRLPVMDDQAKKDEVGRPDPKYFRLWRHIGESLSAADRTTNGRPKPEAVYREAEGALLTLAGQWKKRFDEIRAAAPGSEPVPPVLIVVCDNTEIAEVFFRKISGEVRRPALDADGKEIEETGYEGSVVLPELANAEGVRRTVRIDTGLLRKLETDGEQTKDQAAAALRAVIDTVGKRGGPGEQVRCVVSVSMLTEGWDASNVTHVLGVRAFGSQLLCEQVVGRGLRRMSYVPDPETGRLTPEYVDVYGIPFSLIPFKGRGVVDPKPDPVYHHVYAVPERAGFEIRMPVVESYTYDLRKDEIECDVDTLEELVVEHEPTTVYLASPRGYQDAPDATAMGEFEPQTREEFYRRNRFQQIVFRIAKLILEDLAQGGEGARAQQLRDLALARHRLFPSLVGILNRYVERRVRFAPGVDRRELGLEKYVTLIRQRVRDGILPQAASPEAPLFPVTNSYNPVVSTAKVDYRTARPVVPLEKSHLNLAAYHSELERRAVLELERLDIVECFTPNDRRIGLVIPYQYLEKDCTYEPDFVVRLRGGTLVVLEIKDKGGELAGVDQVKAKNAAAHKWVAAVNNAKRFGRWAFEICREPARLGELLGKHVAGGELLPFRVVTPSPGDRFRTCVPLTTLRAAAGGWSEEQEGLFESLSQAEEWVTWEGAPVFSQGMFVAKVQGASMEPAIPSGSYCLFRPAPAGSRQGRILLIRHSGVTDPTTGGEYTVKRYRSEKAVRDDGGWEHQRIVLEPLNPDFAPIVLEPEHEDEVRVVAEWVQVVGTGIEDH